MPNVAGVQFPYTPQGEQAAQLYQRSLSPRRGLGFRPLRMQEGSTPEHENAMLYIEWAHGEGSDSLPPQFQMNDNSVAELLVIMRNDPEAAVKYANKLKNVVENRSSVIGEVSGGAPMEEELLGNLGRQQALTEMTKGFDVTPRGPAPESALRDTESEFAAHIADVGGAMVAPTALVATGLGQQQALREMNTANEDALLGPVFHGDFTDEEKGYWNRARGARQAREQAGTGLPPYLGVPPSSEQFDDTTAIFNKRIEPLRRLERRPERPPEPWEFGGLGVDSPTPQGMAHGGVPRGTVAGELEPRGYLTARQAGETMRERAKGLRDPRRYGGIGSLYNRYG